MSSSQPESGAKPILIKDLPFENARCSDVYQCNYPLPNGRWLYVGYYFAPHRGCNLYQVDYKERPGAEPLVRHWPLDLLEAQCLINNYLQGNTP